MFHSPLHPFDTMFVILCVFAGASSHSFSNSSRNTPTHLLNHRFRYSFIDLILDASLIKPSRISKSESNSSPESFDDVRQSHLLDILPSNDNNLRKSYNVCTLLSNVLTGNQMKFCIKHQELLEQVVPQIFKLAKEECVKITSDLRWNCTTIGPFLDRSSSLDRSDHSCSCGSTEGSVDPSGSLLKPTQYGSPFRSEISNFIMDQVILDRNEIDKLDTGSPLRLSRSMVKQRGCEINSAFADAFTRTFFDADESKSLAKASKIMNEDYGSIRGKRKRYSDADRKDLSFIKWAKSAVNLHNNHLGRQVVRMAIRRQCRCHGLSGACHFQTCWDQLASFEEIASSIRSIYLNNARLVGYKNLGSIERPDIYLLKLDDWKVDNHRKNDQSSQNLEDRITSNEMAHLYDSPDYCADQPIIAHRGTSGRQCVLENQTPKPSDNARAGNSSAGNNQPPLTRQDSPGSCAYLCCGRGHYSELVLHMVKCNCGFKFCCKVECTDCARQQLQHFCS